MAAERTFLAWIRTGIALMAFGFVVARLGLFLSSVSVAGAAPPLGGSGYSLLLGLALLGLGILVCAVSAFRHQSYIAGIDAGNFRAAFGSRFAFAVVAFLVFSGVGMALFLTLSSSGPAR